MRTNKRLIDLDKIKPMDFPSYEMDGLDVVRYLGTLPTVEAVEVSHIRAYLQKKLDEWNALGDRKYEPANMWGYNFIKACHDDLEAYKTDGEAR